MKVSFGDRSWTGERRGGGGKTNKEGKKRKEKREMA